MHGSICFLLISTMASAELFSKFEGWNMACETPTEGDHHYCVGLEVRCLKDWTGPDCKTPICEDGCGSGRCMAPGACLCGTEVSNEPCTDNPTHLPVYVILALVVVASLVALASLIFWLKQVKKRCAKVGTVLKV